MHISRVHEKSKKFDCTLCEDSFAWVESLKHHMKANHNDGKKDFKCDKCPFETKTRPCLYQHNMRMHKEHSELLPCPFKGCTASYTSKDSFIQHKRRHQKDSENFPYSCDFCGFRFKALKTKNSHERRAHLKGESTQCPICGVTVLDKQALSVHLSKTHPEYDRFFCQICDTKFYGQRKLDIHIETEHSVDSTECDICHKIFKTKKSLSLHKLRYHGIHNDYSAKCDICNKVFKTKKSMSLHKIRYHGIQPCNARPQSLKNAKPQTKSKSEISVKARVLGASVENVVEHDEPIAYPISPFKLVNSLQK